MTVENNINSIPKKPRSGSLQRGYQEYKKLLVKCTLPEKTLYQQLEERKNRKRTDGNTPIPDRIG